MSDTVKKSNEPVRPLMKQARVRRPAGDDGRINDPQRTIADIVTVATEEFAGKSLSGARIDKIAARTRTSKRMIYYYFGSKEGLYLAVLEEAYRRIQGIERGLNLDDLPPGEALRRLVGFTFDYQTANPDFIRLVMNGTLHNGEFLAQSKTVQQLNVPTIDAVCSIYLRGIADRVFRDGLDPLDLHMSISALCFFYGVEPTHVFANLQASPAYAGSARRTPCQRRRHGVAPRARVASVTARSD